MRIRRKEICAGRPDSSAPFKPSCFLRAAEPIPAPGARPKARLDPRPGERLTCGLAFARGSPLAGPPAHLRPAGRRATVERPTAAPASSSKKDGPTIMRARAGDPPRTMPQKILAGRAADPQLRGDSFRSRSTRSILSRAPSRALAEALAAGMKKTPVEVAVAYDGTLRHRRGVARRRRRRRARTRSRPSSRRTTCPIARPGIGFPAPVHLERFAAPARLALTDDPRLATVGGIGMLSLVVSPAQLGQALATGSVWLRPPRSVQIHLSGRVRPFVCARDVALELLRTRPRRGRAPHRGASTARRWCSSSRGRARGCSRSPSARCSAASRRRSARRRRSS